MKSIRFLLVFLFLRTAIPAAADVRTVIDSDTKAHRATVYYGDSMTFVRVSGPQDGRVILRAFRGTREQLIQQAHSQQPACAHMLHLVFGGWWIAPTKLTFNKTYGDWSVSGTDNGEWVFIFDVDADKRPQDAGLLYSQNIDLKQDEVDDYFSSGIEMTVVNTVAMRRASATLSSSSTSTATTSANVLSRVSRPAGTNRTNVVQLGHAKDVLCTIPQKILRDTMVIVSTDHPRSHASLLAWLRPKPSRDSRGAAR